MAILNAFAVGGVGLTLSEICRRAGLPLATGHRLVGELVAALSLVTRTRGADLRRLLPPLITAARALSRDVGEATWRRSGGIFLLWRSLYVKGCRSARTRPRTVGTRP